MENHSSRFRVKHALALVFTVLLAIPSAAPGETRPHYVLAVPTQLSPVEMHSNWAPFVERLSEETGADIRLKVYETISQYEAEVMMGTPDFVFMNPYLAIKTRKRQGYIPLIRDKALLVGILVVSKDSPVNSVKDLDGKEIAFPTPNAFLASLYMRALLQEKGKIRFAPRYVMSHSNVYRSVILGKTAAGGGVNKSLDTEPEEVKSQLRVIFRTPEHAPHPFCGHTRVPQALRRSVVDAIMRLAADKGNLDMMKKVQMASPVEANYERDYQPLEKLNLEKYFVPGGE